MQCISPSVTESYVINCDSFPQCSMIAFISAANLTRDHMNHTPDDLLKSDLCTVHSCAPEFGKQHSHQPNKPGYAPKVQCESPLNQRKIMD